MDLIMLILALGIGISMIIGALCGWLVFVLAWIISRARVRFGTPRTFPLFARWLARRPTWERSGSS